MREDKSKILNVYVLTVTANGLQKIIRDKKLKFLNAISVMTPEIIIASTP